MDVFNVNHLSEANIFHCLEPVVIKEMAKQQHNGKMGISMVSDSGRKILS